MILKLNKFASVSQYCMDCIKKQNISFELVQEFNFDADKEQCRWVENFSYTLSALLSNVTEIKKMYSGYRSYEDSRSQFLFDLSATLGDYVYHASIYCIYYLNIDNVINTYSCDNVFSHDDLIFNNNNLIAEIAKEFVNQCEISQTIQILSEIQKHSIILCRELRKLEEFSIVSPLEGLSVILLKIHYFSLEMHVLYLKLTSFIFTDR